MPLQISENIYRQIFELSEEGIWIARPDGVTLLVNQKMARLLGYTPEEMIGRVGLDFLTQGQEALVMETRKELGKNIKKQRELQFKCKGGGTIWTIATTAPIFDENDNHIGNIAIHTDITERKKAEAQLINYKENLEKLVQERTTQLKDSERLATIGAVAGMVGHDIRNPLQSILSDTFLAKQEANGLPNDETKGNIIASLDGINENIEYINKIVQDLQDFAKPIVPAAKETDLDTLLQNVLTKKVIPQNITVSIINDKRANKLEVDPILLKRVLANLINNSIQAMPNGGKLAIKTSKTKKQLTITVEDTGNGIPDEVKPKLFTPLFTTKSKGQGFGLAVVKRLIDSMKGTIEFESQVGKGTKFTIQLPLYQ